ncbi:ComEC/Rec2 family competence protein [Bacillus litorisediminis]|uniref:ComEC/Rec2 family competence protein n=1 Tax=Bacillus litorisediminis TaxID=2922713 RepID=UPI001FABE6E6|nr:ATP-dependent DNA helicase [Bacillus litorisediminis]
MLFSQKLAAFILFVSFIWNNSAIPSSVERIDVNLREQEIAFTFFALTNGEATLLQFPDGENLLINTGASSSQKELDYWLNLYGVKRISTVIITKEDPGYIGNLEHVIKRYQSRQIILSNRLFQQWKGNHTYPSDIAVQWWDSGTRIELRPDVKLEVLYNGTSPTEGMDFSITFFAHRFLFLSSYGTDSESKLLSEKLQDVNIVKLPNYGGQAITRKLAKHIDPQVAILFNMDSIKPNEKMVKLLNDMWIDAYLTKEHGTITIKCTDVTYEIIHIHPKGKE